MHLPLALVNFEESGVDFPSTADAFVKMGAKISGYLTAVDRAVERRMRQ